MKWLRFPQLDLSPIVVDWKHENALEKFSPELLWTKKTERKKELEAANSMRKMNLYEAHRWLKSWSTKLNKNEFSKLFSIVQNCKLQSQLRANATRTGMTPN